MQSIELIVNDISLDLDGKTKIALVLQQQDLGDINEKVGSFSRSFEVPCTEKNRRALGNSYTFTATTEFPYKKHRAVLKFNGLELPEGIVIVENDGLSNKEIRLTFYLGNAPAYQLLKNIKLRSLCYYDAYHYWAISVIKNTIYYYQIISGLPNDFPFVYPIVAYSNDTNDITAINLNQIYLNFLLPALPLKYVMNEISERIGYKFEGDIINDPMYEKIIFPYSNSNFVRDEYVQNRNNWWYEWSSNGYNYAVDNWNTIQMQDTFVPNLNPFLKHTYGYSYCNGKIKERLVPIQPFGAIGSEMTIYYPDSGWYRIKRVYRFIFNSNAPSAMYFSGVYGLPEKFRNVTMVTRDLNNGTVYNGYPTNFGQPTYYAYGVDGNNTLLNFPNSQWEVTIEGEYLFNAHDAIIFYVYGKEPYNIYYCYYEQEFIATSKLVEGERDIILSAFSSTNVVSDNYSPNMVSPSMCLPDITIGDFIKSLLNIFGCIITIDEINKIIRFDKFEKIVENIPIAIDWTNKFVNIDNANWNTRPTKAGQVSEYFYDSLSAIGGKSFSIRQLEIKDETLPVTSEIIKLPYSGSTTVERFNGEEIAQILLMTGDLVDQPYINQQPVFIGDESKQRILLTDIPRTSFNQPIEIWYYKMSSNNLATPQLIFNNITLGHLGGLAIGYFNREKNMPVGAPQLGWEEFLWENYWKYFEQIFDQYRELNCEMILSPADIQTLDFKIPIYLQQFASYFYIQKINNWTGDKPVKVELLKLN